MALFASPLDIGELQATLDPALQAILSPTILKAIRPSSAADNVAAFFLLLSSLAYITRGHLWDRPDPHYKVWFERPQLVENASGSKVIATRNIAQRLLEGEHEAVIFWGSQSGTAERFAEALGREFYTRFGISALVAVRMFSIPVLLGYGSF